MEGQLLVPFVDAFEMDKKSDGTEAPGWFKGYGSTFGNVDLGDDVVMPGAFDKYLKSATESGVMPHMFFSHNSNEPIGEWLKMEVDKKGLKMEGQLWVGKGIPKAEQAYHMLRSKTGKGLSIGYSNTTPPTWRDGKGGRRIRELNELALGEVSPTAFPMNPKAGISSVKSLLSALEGKDSLSIREAEDLLRDAGGFSREGAKQFLSLVTKGISALRDAEELKAKGGADLLTSIHLLKKAIS
jgi:HK97 family phage prohead protease